MISPVIAVEDVEVDPAVPQGGAPQPSQSETFSISLDTPGTSKTDGHESDGAFGDSDDEEFLDATEGDTQTSVPAQPAAFSNDTGRGGSGGGGEASDSDSDDLSGLEAPAPPISGPPELLGAQESAHAAAQKSVDQSADASLDESVDAGATAYYEGLLRELHARVEARSRSDNAGFKREWQQIELVNANAVCKMGADPRNEHKNKFSNVKVFDATRVTLGRVNDDPCSDYINANYVRDVDGARACVSFLLPVLRVFGGVFLTRCVCACVLAGASRCAPFRCAPVEPRVNGARLSLNTRTRTE